jgi:hypothetical protein
VSVKEQGISAEVYKIKTRGSEIIEIIKQEKEL